MVLVSRRIRDAGIAIVVAMGLYASGLLAIFTPLPILYVSVVRGRKDALVSSIIALIIMAILYFFILPHFATVAPENGVPVATPPIDIGKDVSLAVMSLVGVGWFTFFLTVAIMLGEGAHRRWNLFRWGAYPLVSGLVVIGLMLFLAQFMTGVSVVDLVKLYFMRMVSEVVQLNSSSQSAEMSFIKENAAQMVSIMMSVLPSIVFVMSLVAVVVNLVVGRRFIRRAHRYFSHVKNLARFRLPEVLIWGVIVSGFLFFLDVYILKTTWIKVIALNGVIAMAALYFFQGLAVVVYFLQGIKVPLFKMAAYMAIILFFQTVGLIIVVIGVADVWANFRLRSWRFRHTPQQ